MALIKGNNYSYSESGMKEHASCSRTCSRTCSCSRTRTEQEHEKFLTLRTRTEREQKTLKSRTLFFE